MANFNAVVPVMCSDGQVSQLETILRGFKYEGVSAEAILTAVEEKTKPKSNEIAAFTKLCSLKQGDMPLSTLIAKLRMPLECRCRNADQSLSTPSRVHRL